MLRGALLLWAAAALCTSAQAGEPPAVCRHSGVEWIVGGRGAEAPACERVGSRPAAGGTTAPSAGPAASSARWRAGDAAVERRQILEQELRQEQAALAAALAAGAAASAASVERTRANIAALQKELARP